MTHYAQPVLGNDFFAREDIILNLANSSENIKQGYRQNIAIIGSSLIGKSSLLLNFLTSLRNDKEIVPVYIGLNNPNIREFAINLISGIFYNALRKHAEISKDIALRELLVKSENFFPKSTALAKKILCLIDENRLFEAFSDSWDIAAQLSSESGFFIVMAIDEFSRIADFPIARPFQVLGGKIMLQQKSLFILSSSSAFTARKILSEKLSLLFGGFKVIDICAFNSEECRNFIKTRCRGLRISNALTDFLIALTGGHPFYLSAILNTVNLAQQCGAGSVTAKRLCRMIADLLFSQSGAINQFFSNKINNAASLLPGTSVLDIARFLVKTGCFTGLPHGNITPGAWLNTIIESFLESGLMQKSGSVLSITDPLFRIWIEVKSKSRNLCFDFMPYEGTEGGSDEVYKRFLQFKSERSKTFHVKVAELISSFNDDLFFIDERLRVLPKVGRISFKRTSKYDLLKAEGRKKQCLFIVCRGIITEEVMAGIIEHVKDFKKIKPKVIIITPSGIYPSAKLMAKQKYYWVWDKDDTIRLFKFYKGINLLSA